MYNWLQCAELDEFHVFADVRQVDVIGGVDEGGAGSGRAVNVGCRASR